MSLLANLVSESIQDPTESVRSPSISFSSTPNVGSGRKGKGKVVPEKNKMIAAVTGATITSLTMTPFDVIKTRLQTQMPSEPLFLPSSHLPPPSNLSSTHSPWPRPIASTSSLPPLRSSASRSAASLAATNLATCCQKTYFTSNIAESSLLCRFDPRVSTSALPASGSHLATSSSSMPIRPIGLSPSLPSLVHTSIPVPTPVAACVYPSPAIAILQLPSQSLPSSSRHLLGFWDAVGKIVKHEGLSAMWRGTGPALAMSVPGQVIYMLGYDYGRRTAFDQAPTWAYVPTREVDGLRVEERKLRASYLTCVPLIAGGVSRTFVAALVSPVELLRTRLQSSTTGTTIPAIFYAMKANGGWRSAWKGLPATLWRDVPFSGIYWASYEGFKRTLTGGKGMGESSEDQTVGEEFAIAFISGAGSGMIAATLTNPFDVVKTRRQAGYDTPASSRSSTNPRPPMLTKTFSIILDIAKKEGMPGLMRGLAPRLAKVGPACGIMIASYEGLGRMLSE